MDGGSLNQYVKQIFYTSFAKNMRMASIKFISLVTIRMEEECRNHKKT